MYNYKVYGLSGREAFPHSQFWFVDLHGLVNDGCYYSLDLAKVPFPFVFLKRFPVVFHSAMLPGCLRQGAQVRDGAGHARQLRVRLFARADI